MDPEYHQQPAFSYVILLDFQATCDEQTELKPCQEIIQINLVMLHCAEGIPSKVRSFRELVRPKINQKLSQYCQKLTGIKTEDVKKAAYLTDVLASAEEWIKSKPEVNLGNTTFVTWGSWDLQVCLKNQLATKKEAFPKWIGSFIDFKRFLHRAKIQQGHKSLEQWCAAVEVPQQLAGMGELSKGQKDIYFLEGLVCKLSKMNKFRPFRKQVDKIFNEIPGVTISQELEYLLVLDFEATCEDNVKLEPCSEIIQFPVMVVDLKQRKVIDKFHHYITPSFNPKLTKFCTELTGITQQMVDGKMDLKKTLEAFDQWIWSLPYLHSKNFTFVTCGDWDLASCLKKQCREKGIQQPDYLKDYINIKHPVGDLIPAIKGKTGMMEMLQHLNIPHEGRHHSGIDDVLNISNIALGLLKFEGFHYSRKLLRYVK